MRLDDLGRRAADEVKKASRSARFTVRSPTERRRLLARPAVALGAAAMALAVGVPLLLLYGPWVTPVTEVSLTTTESTTLTVTSTTTADPGKAPAASIDELVERLYASLSAFDTEAFRALSAPGALHSVYYTDGTSGAVLNTFAHDVQALDAFADQWESVEVRGQPVAAGNALAIPVAYTYPYGVLTGFDLIVLRWAEGGWLLGGGATFFGTAGLEADPAAARTAVAAEVAAWNAGDVDGVLATMTDDAVLYISKSADPAAFHFSGSSLRDNVATFFDLEITGEPVLSGAFAVLPAEFADDSGDRWAGVAVYCVRGNLIALHAMGM